MPKNNGKERRAWRKLGADRRAALWDKIDPQKVILRKGPGKGPHPSVGDGLNLVRADQMISRL